MKAAVKHIGQFHAGKTKPTVATAADGAWSVQLLLVDRQGPHRVEPWRVTYNGPEARAWWDAEGSTLASGDTVEMSCTHARPHSIGRGFDKRTEIHARVDSIAITARAGANRRTTTQAAEATA